MVSVIMLSITNKPVMLSVVMLNVVMLNVMVPAAYATLFFQNSLSMTAKLVSLAMSLIALK
jgi:hypothetical protein